LIPPQCAPLPPTSFTPNSITLILSTATYLSLKFPASNRFRNLSPVQLLKLLNPVTSLLRSLHWLKIIECIEYKLLSLTYKVLITIKPPYLHNLISVQPPCSTRSSSLVTLARPPTSSSLRITDRSFRYASPCLWNQFPIVLSPSTSLQSLCLCPACLCPYHIFSLCQVTTLTIHNSLSLSLAAQDLYLSQHFPTIDSLPASGLTPRTFMTRLFLLSISFYSARNARIASAVLATAIPSVRPSVCLSVCPSVRHTPVLCQNDGT